MALRYSIIRHSIFPLLSLLLLGCSSSLDYSQSEHFNASTGRFEHPNGDNHHKSFMDLIGLASKFMGREQDEWEEKGFPLITSSQENLADFRENMMWIGHSTVMLNHAGTTILTDPQFSGRASPFSFWGPKRITPTPFDIGDLPRIDVVLISHNHYDHLDEKSIRALAQTQSNIKFLVPLGLAPLLKDWGAEDVEELDWWQPVTISGVEIQPTPVQHWSKRSFFDRNKTLWAGWMLRWEDFSFYFAGDTGYSDDFKVTAKRLGSPTLAAIPIGAYEPRDFMKTSHLNPEEAVKAFTDLGAKYAFGIHWGTFKLTLEKMDEPPVRLKSALEQEGVSKDVFRVLTHGETWNEPLSK
jgi:N-acyl-phosphatidylethanolamine-hydrolysing phospholipase D